VLRRIIVPERQEVIEAGESFILRNFIIYNLHQILLELSNKGVGHVAHKGERRNAYKTFVGKPEGRRLLGRLTHRSEDNVKWILKE